MKIQLEHRSQTYTLTLAQTGRQAVITLNGQTYTVEILRAGDGWLDFRFSTSQSVLSSVFVSADGPQRWVTVNGQTFTLTQSTGTAKHSRTAQHDAGVLVAPMPGQIRMVQVTDGEAVSKGQALVVLEAMKMEIKVIAPFDGVVKAVKVKPGQTVEKDERLVEMENSA